MKDTTINIILADDDRDDCLLFEEAILELELSVRLILVHDGEQLMKVLTSTAVIPYALFLDLNMPRKNGFECLMEIKDHSSLINLPVIIYSTSYDKEKANQLYNSGAHYYISKPSNFEELKKVVNKAIKLLNQNYLQPAKEDFYINNYKSV